MPPKRAYGPLPVLSHSVLAPHNGVDRVSYRIPPPSVKPETTIANWRAQGKLNGFDVVRYDVGIEGGRIAWVEVVCVVHKGGERWKRSG